MKRVVISALVLLIVLAACVNAKETKVGIIVSARILEEFDEAIEAQQILTEEINEWQRQALQMEEELTALQEELSQQASMFYSEEKRQEKETEFQTKFEAYRQFQAQTEQRAVQRNQELFQPINDKIQKVIDEIAVEMGFDIIFDAVGSNIAYLGDQTLDITDRVLEELNKQ